MFQIIVWNFAISTTSLSGELKLISTRQQTDTMGTCRAGNYLGRSDCNGTQTHNHLVRKRAFNHSAKLAGLAKRLSVCLRTKRLWVRVPLQSRKLQISRLFRAGSSLTFRQLWSEDSL